MREISFIHAADLHLDSPFTGLKNMPADIVGRLREATFKAFQKVVDAAIYHKVDFMLVAGDLYDGENRSIRAQVRFRKEMDRLNKYNIPVFIIHGNHDHLDGNWVKLDFPENVHTFLAETEVKTFNKMDGTTVNIYGFSYPKRHVQEKMISRYERKEGADFHIGMLHGNLEGSTEHGPYAPFTIKELIDKNLDYWALGHIHKRLELLESPGIIYPGNIQGRNRKESGEKGCYLIKLTENHMEKNFIETADIVWESVKVEMNKSFSFDELLFLCRQQMSNFQREGKGVLLQIELHINGHNEDSSYIPNDSDEILTVLQEEVIDIDFVWPYSLKIVKNSNIMELSSSPFVMELIKAAEEELVESALELNSLYGHPQARKFLDELTDEERTDLREQSKQLVLQLLSSP